MLVSFADFYQNNLSNKKLLKIRDFLNDKKLPINEKKLNQFLTSLGKEIIKKFGIKKVDFPYYHYYPNPTYKREEILIDVSINDKLDWQSIGKDNLSIPKKLKNLSIKYQKLSAKEPIIFDTGFYRTESKKTREIEENIMTLSDKYFGVLQKILLSSREWQKKSDAAFLIGYAVKHEKFAIDILVGSLKDKDHAIHNVVARSLFPKIFVKKADIWSLKELLSHHNPYCQNKFLGIAANIDINAENKKKLQKIKEIQEKTQYSQMIVSYAAKMLIEKIK